MKELGNMAKMLKVMAICASFAVCTSWLGAAEPAECAGQPCVQAKKVKKVKSKDKASKKHSPNDKKLKKNSSASEKDKSAL